MAIRLVEEPGRLLTLEKAFADVVRDHMAAAGFSQLNVARRLHRSQGWVSYLLAHKRREHGLSVYSALAAIFGLTLSELIAEAEARQEEMPDA
jgi:transcriptional regulator with XRE-family HTH domain